MTDRILTDENFDRREFSPTEFLPTEFSPTEFSPNMEFFLIQIVFPILFNHSIFENQGKFPGKMHFCISILSFF
jgi:hypothetical protein